MVKFSGVKIALIFKDKIIVIQRDNKPGLNWANMWDLPGGRRENEETGFKCVQREVFEELGINLAQESIIWEKVYPAVADSKQDAIFMVAHITQSQIDNIVFGDEGQGWKLISTDEFLNDSTVIEQIKGRVKDYLNANPIKNQK